MAKLYILALPMSRPSSSYALPGRCPASPFGNLLRTFPRLHRLSRTWPSRRLVDLGAFWRRYVIARCRQLWVPRPWWTARRSRSSGARTFQISGILASPERLRRACRWPPSPALHFHSTAFGSSCAKRARARRRGRFAALARRDCRLRGFLPRASPLSDPRRVPWRVDGRWRRLSGLSASLRVIAPPLSLTLGQAMRSLRQGPRCVGRPG